MGKRRSIRGQQRASPQAIENAVLIALIRGEVGD